MSAAWWAALAWVAVGVRLSGAPAVSARRVPAWSGPLVDLLLWIGGPATLDLAALSNVELWLGLIVLLLLWSPAMALARRPSTRRRTGTAALGAGAVLALTVQTVTTQALLAGMVDVASEGQVCQWPRTVMTVSGDLFPEPPGTTRTACVQGRPGGGYLGD